MQGTIHDLKMAFRNIRLQPWFSLMVIGMLALGIAGNSAIFSILTAWCSALYLSQNRTVSSSWTKPLPNGTSGT